MIKFFLLLTSVFCSTIVLAQKPEAGVRSWPIPDVPDLLFYIQRDPDVNTVVYTLNKDETGLINPKDPINIFWIKYTEGGVHKPLNLLQKDLAYGLSVEPAGHEQYHLKAVAYPKIDMLLQKDKDNKYHVRLTLDSHKCVLKRIYIHIVGGSHLHPDVAFLEFHGTEMDTGKMVTEKIFPH